MRGVAAAAIVLLASGCAGLGLADVINPPRFSAANEMNPRLELVGPTVSNPYGGARVRLFARVENPNTFGLTLSSLAGTLFLSGQEAAQVDLPLGLPLQAGQDTVLPIDLTIGFDDIPDLADVARNALGGGRLDYRMDGTVGVNAGPLGNPTFGPMTLVEGDMAVLR